MLPKFLVCTLYSGEPDYNHCVRALSAQKDVTFEHRIISGLNEIDAHNACYSAFNECPADTIRVKLDADVELFHDRVLWEAFKHLEKTPTDHGISPKVLDYITETEICAGVMFYTPHVEFTVQTNPLKCDRGMIQRAHEHRIAPGPAVGRHMFYANDLTAFRYGFHRGLKSQMDVYRNTRRAWEKNKDRIRHFAVLGFEAAQSEQFHDWHNVAGTAVPNNHSYGDEVLMRLFNVAAKIVGT